MSKDLKLRIAGVSISLEGARQNGEWEIPVAYDPFLWTGRQDISLRLYHGIPESLKGEKLFESPPIWTLYRQNGTSFIRIFGDQLFPGLERTLLLTRDMKEASLYFSTPAAANTGPFHGPAMELLMINYLAQGKGAIIHACGIERKGKGILFVGESGAGKSTLANMWAQEAGVDLLSDDRIIVRKNGERFWMYGTPWHGDAAFASPQGVPVERMLFLRQGGVNSTKKIKGVDAVSRLITCSFLPHWDSQGMAFSMDLFTDLAAHIPCSEFTFKPDRSAIEFVKELTT
jgi:hypothetical protein